MLVKLTWASASHGNWIECGCWLQVEMIRSCPLAPVNVRFPPTADLTNVRCPALNADHDACTERRGQGGLALGGR